MATEGLLFAAEPLCNMVHAWNFSSTIKGWECDKSTPLGDCCLWEGVYCETIHKAALLIYGTDMSGDISMLSPLSALSRL